MFFGEDITPFLGVVDLIFRRVASTKGGDGVSKYGEGLLFHEGSVRFFCHLGKKDM